MSKQPIAVLISDIHFSINTLDLASNALKQSVDKANELNVPLIVAGDIHDSKANIRGECIKAMLDILEMAVLQPYVIVANHDRINEKSTEHSLEFLRNTVCLVTEPRHYDVELDHYKGKLGYLIPYYHDPVQLKAYLTRIPSDSRLIMHQGLKESNSGDYIQDKSAISKEDVADFRVISGHYHQRQNIKCGRPRKGAVGLWSYIGNSYTLNFGEANDPPKGFQILMDDGTLEFVPTNLRKHVVLNIEKANNNYWQITGKIPVEDIKKEDLVLVKMRGTKEDLISVNKDLVSKLIDKKDFRLDIIPLESETSQVLQHKNLTQSEILDGLIDSLTNTSNECKVRLKQTWKDLT